MRTTNRKEYVMKSGKLLSCYSRERQIKIPDGIKSIDYYAFEDNDVTEIIILNKEIKRVNVHAFCRCTNLKNIFVDPKNETFYSEDGILYEKTKKGVRLVTVPRGKQGRIIIPKGVSCISCYAFEKCSEITDVEIPDSVTVIESYAFCGCSKIKHIKAMRVTTCIEVCGANTVIPLTFPQIPFLNYRNLNWKMSLVLGFLYNPELYNEGELDLKPDRKKKRGTYANYAMMQKRYVLPYVFKFDQPKMLQFYVDRNGISEKNFEKMFLCPAQEASAERCVAFLLDWKSENK